MATAALLADGPDSGADYRGLPQQAVHRYCEHPVQLLDARRDVPAER